MTKNLQKGTFKSKGARLVWRDSLDATCTCQSRCLIGVLAVSIVTLTATEVTRLSTAQRSTPSTPPPQHHPSFPSQSPASPSPHPIAPPKAQQPPTLACNTAPPPPCSAMSSSFWADACNSARDRPLQTLIDTVHASCGATVRRAAVRVVRVARGW